MFGDYNPAGRLPVTFYRNIAQLPDFEDYNMTGRTYRYFKGDPLFPFGYGLSYTTFNYDNIKLDQTIKVGETAKMVIPVTNAGNRDGEEVVQVYLKNKKMRKDRLKHCVLSNVYKFLQENSQCRIRVNTQTIGMVGRADKYHAHHSRKLRYNGRG